MSTLLLKMKMKIETLITSQVGKSNRPYFKCIHHRLVPAKHPHRHWHNSKLNSWYWKLVYIPDTSMVSGFFRILNFCTGTHFRSFFFCLCDNNARVSQLNARGDDGLRVYIHQRKIANHDHACKFVMYCSRINSVHNSEIIQIIRT